MKIPAEHLKIEQYALGLNTMVACRASAIKATHLPTGLTCSASEYRSAHANEEAAIEGLAEMVYLAAHPVVERLTLPIKINPNIGLATYEPTLYSLAIEYYSKHYERKDSRVLANKYFEALSKL